MDMNMGNQFLVFLLLLFRFHHLLFVGCSIFYPNPDPNPWRLSSQVITKSKIVLLTSL